MNELLLQRVGPIIRASDHVVFEGSYKRVFRHPRVLCVPYRFHNLPHSAHRPCVTVVYAASKFSYRLARGFSAVLVGATRGMCCPGYEV